MPPRKNVKWESLELNIAISQKYLSWKSSYAIQKNDRKRKWKKNLRTKSWPWDRSKPAAYAIFRRTQYWLGCLAFMMPPRKSIKLESLELNIAISRKNSRGIQKIDRKRKWTEILRINCVGYHMLSFEELDSIQRCVSPVSFPVIY